MALDDCPELLTIAEAAQFLRISRTTAYAEAKRYERTDEGLPVIRWPTACEHRRRRCSASSPALQRRRSTPRPDTDR